MYHHSTQYIYYTYNAHILYNPPSVIHLPVHPLPTTLQGSELISKRVLPPSDNIDSPVLSFVPLEHYNAIRLTQTIHSNLAALNRVLRGSSLLTPSLQQLPRALLQHEMLM